eukprot:Opistho-2@52662
MLLLDGQSKAEGTLSLAFPLLLGYVVNRPLCRAICCPIGGGGLGLRGNYRRRCHGRLCLHRAKTLCSLEELGVVDDGCDRGRLCGRGCLGLGCLGLLLLVGLGSTAKLLRADRLLVILRRGNSKSLCPANASLCLARTLLPRIAPCGRSGRGGGCGCCVGGGGSRHSGGIRGGGDGRCGSLLLRRQLSLLGMRLRGGRLCGFRRCGGDGCGGGCRGRRGRIPCGSITRSGCLVILLETCNQLAFGAACGERAVAQECLELRHLQASIVLCGRHFFTRNHAACTRQPKANHSTICFSLGWNGQSRVAAGIVLLIYHPMYSALI